LAPARRRPGVTDYDRPGATTCVSNSAQSTEIERVSAPHFLRPADLFAARERERERKSHVPPTAYALEPEDTRRERVNYSSVALQFKIKSCPLDILILMNSK
jgi:hypothetical protein